MSMLPALDESEKNLSHGWSTSTIYGMDSIATNQEGSQNIYQHLINQNNSGNVPDAVVEEEIVPQNGQMQIGQTGSPMSNQRFPAGQMNVNVIQPQQHQVINHPPMQQQTAAQFEPQRSQHSLISPQVSVGAGTKKITYVIPQGQGMPKSTNPSGTVIHGQQKVQNFVPTVPTNTRQQEDMIDQALKLQQRKIAENKEILEAYKKMGFQSAGNNVQSPQVPLSLSSVTLPNFTVKTMNQSVMNNSSPAQNSIDVKMVQSGGATNQAKSVLQLNPTGLVNRPRAVSKPGTFVQQGFRPQIIHNNKFRPSGNIRPQHNNPVQVSMVSSNQVHTNTNPYPGNSNQLNPGNINKKNVILEGGGEFEEGQAYVIRDKDGKSTTRVWRNGDFVPIENSSIIQHGKVDSSQRGRGSRGGRGGRGRGRGQGQMNNTGVRTPSPRATPRPTRFPTPRVTQPNFNVRGPNNVIRHDTPQMNHVRPRHPSMPSGMPSGIPSPQTIIIQTPSPQLSLSPHNASQTPPSRTEVQQTPIIPKLDIKNLMPPSLPPAQGSQKTAQPSGTNLARDQISQEEKEEPDKDLTQYLSTSLPPDSQGGKQEVLDPPRIPTDPNAVAVCQFCGYISEDKIKCESCNRKFTSATRYQVKGTGALISEDGGPKKRKAEPSEKTIGVSVNKKAFYGGKKLQDQEKLYHQILQSANGNVTVSFQNPRIIVRGSRTRGRGRGRGRGMVIPETITLSSDEEENGESGHRGSGDVITASQTKSMSAGDQSSSQQGPPESPLIPEIPISSAKGDSRSRRDKMEDATGKASKDREGSASPVNVLLNARSITVGTFKGIPIEPVVLCKNGLRFFMEGQHGSHRFTILPGEIQQCLAHFSERSLSYLFFLVSKSCGMRTRRDLGIKYHKDPKMPPPEPYFDPFGSDLTHQMITVIMEKIELTVRVEFQKYMDLFKSWGKSGDEAFFMELTEQEADEVRKQSLSSAVQPASAYTSQGMSGGDHQYTQHGDEDRRSRSPSPPRMGFVGYSIIKLLTYPPPPEKGGIPITNEDLFCLQEGEFLNDVIIDFYLKYLHNEILSEKDRERTHIFSSFFYKRLTQRIRGAAIDDDPNLALPEKRHARVKTWTRHVDLFKKDFIVIPINEHAHWFLAIVCYPWLMEPVKNRYIPNRCSTPLLENLNIPTPPQPTDDNTDEMDGEEQENPDPSTDKPEEQSQAQETPTVSDNTTTTTESQSTESEQSTQPSQEVNDEKQGDASNATTDNASTENPESENKSENMEVEQSEQKEDPLQTDSEKTDSEKTESGPTDGEGEPMDTSEKSEETSQTTTTTTQGSDECTDSQEKPDENVQGSDECREDGEKTKEKGDEKKEGEEKEEASQGTSQEEVSQETAQSETQTQTRTATPKPAQSQKLPNIRPIRGQTVEEGDTSTLDDVMTGIKQPCVLIFDSLSGPSRSRIVTVLKEYLQVEWQVKKATEAGRALNKAVIRGCVPKVPQQNNYSDCGVFMLQYVESFFEDPIQDFATPMKGLHDWFSLQKIEGKREELKDLIISLKEKYESTED